MNDHEDRCLGCENPRCLVSNDGVPMTAMCPECGDVLRVDPETLCEDCRRVYIEFLAGQLGNENQ